MVCVLVVWFCCCLLIVEMHWGLRLALSCQSAHRQCYIVFLITHACGLLPILGSLWLHSLHGHCFCLRRPAGWWVRFPHPAVRVTLTRGQLTPRSAEDLSKALTGAKRPLQWGEDVLAAASTDAEDLSKASTPALGQACAADLGLRCIPGIRVSLALEP